MFCLDRDGTVIDTDKGMWQQGLFTWLLATLYNTVEARDEWLELARHGISFIRKHGFDEDGRMFFQVTREGQPVRKRRYVFTETFATIALAAYAKAGGEEQAAQEARDLLSRLGSSCPSVSFTRCTAAPRSRCARRACAAASVGSCS